MDQAWPVSTDADILGHDVNIGLVDNLLEVRCPTPVELIPFHVLRRPTPAELDRLRNELRKWGGVGDATIPFESTVTGDEHDLVRVRSANFADWYYWVVAVNEGYKESYNGGLCELAEVSRITDIELRFPLQICRHGPVIEGDLRGGPRPTLMSRFPRKPLVFDDRTVKLIGELYALLKKVETSHPSIYKAVQRYERLGIMQTSQELYVLGAFAVMEAILTHDPAGSYDSLGHQIKHKMKLLNSRFAIPLDLRSFGGISFEKLWSRLYEVRSLIAHGRDPEFTGRLQILKSFRKTREFLDQAVKILLRQALREPQLITDLQAC